MQQVLDVVQAHIAAADRIHFGKNHKLATHLMPVSYSLCVAWSNRQIAVPVSPATSALVVCAAIEVFPSLHFRDECCPAFDKVTEAIMADTPLYDVLGPAYAEGDDGLLRVPQLGRQSVTVEKDGRGMRRELQDRVRWSWATGVPANAESLACLVAT